MSTTLIGPAIKQVGDVYELNLRLSPEILTELGLDQNEPVVLELSEGRLVIRRATIVEQTAGALAKYAKYPPTTIEEMKEAFAQGVAEENAGYE